MSLVADWIQPSLMTKTRENVLCLCFSHQANLDVEVMSSSVKKGCTVLDCEKAFHGMLSPPYETETIPGCC